MAIYLGKEQLEHALKLAKRQEDIKGIQGEIKVGELLDQYLPDDTYLIAQPEIGNYQPDFLVISPRYGFRIIEVKNISLNSISNIQSNGNYTTRYGSRNYLNQVRAHVDDLKSYLLSNHPYLGDTHKMIGYCVLNIGFSKGDLEKKFEVQIDSWDESHLQDFFKYHLFIDQLNGHIDTVLGKTTKFPYSRVTPLTTTRMKEIANNMKIGEISIDVVVVESSVETETSNSKSKRKWILTGVTTVLLAGILTYFTLFSSDSISLANLEDRVGDTVHVEATVTSFYYDEGSKTKFLKLQDGTERVDAVIFDGVKVPFMSEGDKYTFIGEVQLYDGKIELNIESVE